MSVKNDYKKDNLAIIGCLQKSYKLMQSFNTWNLTNNQLHELFKNENQFISIKVRGNTWEPISRWLRLDSRIFKETTNRQELHYVISNLQQKFTTIGPSDGKQKN